MRPVEDHTLRREPADVRRLQYRLGVVNLQVKRRLVIDNDEQDVRFGLGRRLMRKHRQAKQRYDERCQTRTMGQALYLHMELDYRRSLFRNQPISGGEKEGDTHQQNVHGISQTGGSRGPATAPRTF